MEKIYNFEKENHFINEKNIQITYLDFLKNSKKNNSYFITINTKEELKNLLENFFDFDITICSKNMEILEEKINFKKQLIAYNFMPENILFCLNNKCDIMLEYKCITKERITDCHNLNIKVNAFNIKDDDIVDLLEFWNVDFITKL